MLALQLGEADPSRFYAPHGSSDVAQLRRVEVDRVIARRAEIGDRPGARMPDRRGKDRGRRQVAILHCACVKDCRHCSGLQLFRRICTAKIAAVQPGRATLAETYANEREALKPDLYAAAGERASFEPCQRFGYVGE